MRLVAILTLLALPAAAQEDASLALDPIRCAATAQILGLVADEAPDLLGPIDIAEFPRLTERFVAIARSDAECALSAEEAAEQIETEIELRSAEVRDALADDEAGPTIAASLSDDLAACVAINTADRSAFMAAEDPADPCGGTD